MPHPIRTSSVDGTDRTASTGSKNTTRLAQAAALLTPAERCNQAANELNKGREAFHAKELSTAIEHFTLATELDPRCTAARCNRAAAYLKLRMWADASADCDAVLVLDPGSMKAYMRRAVAKGELKDWHSAKEDALVVLNHVCPHTCCVLLCVTYDGTHTGKVRRA